MKKIRLLILSLYTACMPCFSEVSQIVEEDLPLDSMLSHGTMHDAGIFRAMISLGIVIGLIYLTAWAYKKLNVFNTTKLVKNDKNLNLNRFKLISTQSLGSNKNLHVVEINGKYLVLGSTPNSINLIKEFDKEQETEEKENVEVKKADLFIDELLNKYDNNEKNVNTEK